LFEKPFQEINEDRMPELAFGDPKDNASRFVIAALIHKRALNELFSKCRTRKTGRRSILRQPFPLVPLRGEIERQLSGFVSFVGTIHQQMNRASHRPDLAQ
jgi:hypothetical protein